MTPYTQRCEKFGGGVISVELIEAEGLLSAFFDHQKDCFTSIVCAPGYTMANIELPDEGSSFVQLTTEQGGIASTEQRLTLALNGMGDDSLRVLEQLTGKEMVALVKSRDTTLMVGYCAQIGSPYPLRVESAAANSSKKLSERSLATITLTAKTPFGAKKCNLQRV